MNSQDALFHENLNDALRHAVKALGGFEVVGSDLWPTKGRKAAGILLSDCLNPERPAKLDLDDVVGLLKLARDRGVHCAMQQLCLDAGYKTPEIAAAKTPRQELATKMQRAAAEYSRLADEAAALDRAEIAR
jgi:hypothetical protein